MPAIRPYENQVTPNGTIPSREAAPSDVAPNYVPLGQAVESGGYAAGHAQALLQDQASRAAVTDVQTMLAGAQAAYTQKLAEFKTKANPKDNNLVEQFIYGNGDQDQPGESSLKWYLDQYRNQITDPQALHTFNVGAAHLTTKFVDELVHVQSQMAGVYAQQQTQAQIDADQVTLSVDPSQYQDLLATRLKAIDDPQAATGRLTAAQREPIKRMVAEQYSKSTMQGIIRISPEQALAQLTNGTHGLQLRGEDIEPLARSAETAIRGKEVEARRVEAEAQRQKKAQYDATDQSFGTKYGLHLDHPGNPNFPPLTATEIAQAMKPEVDKLDGATGRAWLNKIEADSREPREPKTDPGTFSRLLKDIYRDYGDPEKLTTTNPILDAAVGHRLSTGDFKFLREEYVKARTDEGQTLGSTRENVVNSFKASITKSNPAMGQLDRDGDILYGRFQVFAAQKEEQLRKANEDPNSLYQTGSKNYIGQYLPQFQKTMTESIKSIAENLKRAPTATAPATGGTSPDKHRLPKETPEQYLERMKKP